MKNNKVKTYAKALSQAILEKRSNENKIADNFLKLLKKQGLESKAKEIIRLAEDFILKGKGKNRIVVETARKMTAGQMHAVESLKNQGDILEEKISPEIIAGIKITINSEKQLDASLAKKIQNMF